MDRLLEDFHQRDAFPGGVLAVGHQGKLVHRHPCGQLSYDADAPPVRPAVADAVVRALAGRRRTVIG